MWCRATARWHTDIEIGSTCLRKMPRHFHHATVLSMIFDVDGLLGGYQIPCTLFHDWQKPTNPWQSGVYKRVWQKVTRVLKHICRRELETTQVIMWLLHITQFSHLSVLLTFLFVIVNRKIVLMIKNEISFHNKAKQGRCQRMHTCSINALSSDYQCHYDTFFMHITGFTVNKFPKNSLDSK